VRVAPDAKLPSSASELASLVASLGSLAESELAYANSERINCVRNLCDLRRIFADAKILALITLKRNKRPLGQESGPTTRRS